MMATRNQTPEQTARDNNVSIANHPKTVKELAALNVDEKMGKVTKPAGGSKDCIDAVVSLVALLKKVPRHRYFSENWIPPNPPAMQLTAGGNYEINGKVPERGNVRVTYAAVTMLSVKIMVRI